MKVGGEGGTPLHLIFELKNNNMSKLKISSNEESVNIDLALMAKDITYIKADVAEIKRNQNENFVTKSEFDPVKRVVYAMVSLVLLAVAGAVISLVIKK
jgi:hypothetical protein